MQQRAIPAGVLGDDVEPDMSPQGVDFLRSRLALFARSGAVLLGAHFVLVNLLRSIEGKSLGDWFSTIGIAEIGTAAFLGLLWAVLRFTKLERELLHAADTVGTLSLVGGLALVGYLARHSWAPEMIVMVGGFFALSARATLVPSTAFHTLRVGGIAAVVQTLALYLIAGSATQDHPAWYYAAIGACWSGLIVATTTISTRIIYGLRLKVSRAARLGQYVLEEKIGEGAMGVVFRASHAILARPTAVKLLRKDALGARAEERFRREVFATARLSNPSTVAIYDCGTTPTGALYYAMELLDGVELDVIIRETGPMPEARVIEIMRQTCQSLAEAHDAGLIHRDVKPGNLMLCRHGGRWDVTKVLDFGLVRQTSERLRDADGNEAPNLTGEMNLVGTPLFMAPEAITDPLSVDGRTDLYALGATAYYLLTGHLVFEARSRSEAFQQNLNSVPLRPSSRLGRSISPDLEALVLQCLSKLPEERPASARDLERRLERCHDADRWSQADAEEWWRNSPFVDRVTRIPDDLEAPFGILSVRNPALTQGN